VLIPSDGMERRFPLAWSYLRKWEKELRGRESSAFDDGEWYRFGRHQGLEKQDRLKLVVPRLVKHLACSLDAEGIFHLDNVDVGGVTPGQDVSADYLLGILNGDVADFVFRRVSKPFQNGYWSANRQFIAPIPVPRADAATQAEIGAAALALQSDWTRRRDLLARAGRRLARLGRTLQSDDWLWGRLPEIVQLEDLFRKRKLDRPEARKRAEEEREAEIARRVSLLQGHLDSRRPLAAVFAEGELTLTCGGETVIGGIPLTDTEGALATAHWRFLLLLRPRDAKKLAADLRKRPLPGEDDSARQFMETVSELAVLTDGLRAMETAMNARLHALYGLLDNERDHIEKDCVGRLPL
jgi:TaqI-like C-terminal specificity domain